MANEEELKKLRQLQIAVWMGDDETVEKLIQEKVDVNGGGAFHVPMCLAVWKGFTSIVSLLISTGADVNKIDCNINSDVMGEAKWIHDQYIFELFPFHYLYMFMNSISPLLVASSKGFLSLIKRLLKAGADVNLANCDWFPLVAASQGGHYECVEYLISAGANINQRDEWFNTAVFYACIGNEKKCLRSLIDAGCCINLENHYGETPLIYTVKHGKIKHLKILIKAGVDINFTNKNCETALFNAALQWNPDCVKILLDSGAHVDSVNKIGDTPLIVAAMTNKEENIKLLLQYNPDVNKVNKALNTALWWTIENGNFTCVDLLIKKGADVNQGSLLARAIKTAVQFSQGRILSLGENNKAIAKLLIRKGADVNKCDCFGNTPLMKAAIEGYDDLVTILLERGGDVNLVDDYGYTALMNSVFYGRVKCVKLLLTHSNINYVNYQFVTAFNVALNCARLECMKILLSAGAFINNGDFSTRTFLLNIQKANDQTELVEVLYASGQQVDPVYKMEVEAFSSQLQEKNLKHFCRKTITKHLISLDRYSHLYNRIPHIGLPNLLKDYLLYNTSLS